jgi:hypothetical protein
MIIRLQHTKMKYLVFGQNKKHTILLCKSKAINAFFPLTEQQSRAYLQRLSKVFFLLKKGIHLSKVLIALKLVKIN